MYFADDHIVCEIQLLVLVEATIVNRVVVTLCKQLQIALLVSLLRHDAMNDWDALTWELVDNDIAVDDWRVFSQQKDVATLHTRLHRAREYDNDRTLSPECQLHHIPHHDRRRHNHCELEDLIDKLCRHREQSKGLEKGIVLETYRSWLH